MMRIKVNNVIEGPKDRTKKINAFKADCVSAKPLKIIKNFLKEA